jgi:hypothetical protein
MERKTKENPPTSLIFLRLPSAFQTRFYLFSERERRKEPAAYIGKGITYLYGICLPFLFLLYVFFLFLFLFLKEGNEKGTDFILCTERDLIFIKMQGIIFLKKFISDIFNYGCFRIEFRLILVEYIL